MKVNNPIKKGKNELLKKKKIVVFVEKLIRYIEDGEKRIYILLDFPTKKSNKNIFFERIQQEFNVAKSMLEIKNIKFDKNGIIPREGHYYYLPDKLIEGYNWIPFQENDIDLSDQENNSILSSFIALSSSGTNENVRFERALKYVDFAYEVKQENVSNWTTEIENFLNVNINKVEVNVFDVGQGNWNEILFNEEFLLVYDLGASSSSFFLKTYNRVALTLRRNSRINNLLHGNILKKVLIISHWDIDHYNGVFDVSDSLVSSFDFCLVPNKIENETTLRALEKLKKSTVVYEIEMNPRGVGRGATSLLTVIFDSNFLKIYKGTKCSNRNKRGLLLSLHMEQNHFIFPADHHYEQIHHYVLKNCLKQKFNIVIPHHGGYAGNFRIMDKWFGGNDSIISSGNRFGHPVEEVVEKCEIKFLNIHRTDINSDYHNTIHF